MIGTLTRPKAERGPHPYGVLPPYLRVPDFLPYWPAGRTALYQAIQKGRFYSFIIRDELNKSGVRVIDVESAFGYLRSLAEKAKKPASGPNAEQTPAPGATVPKLELKPILGTKQQQEEVTP